MFSLGLGAALTAAVGAYMLGTNASRAASAPPAVTRLVIQSPTGTQIVSGHREIAVSADGRQVAFIARDPAEQHIYVRRLDELESHQVAGTGGAARHPELRRGAHRERFRGPLSHGAKGAGAAPALIVVQHWDEELKRLVPTRKLAV